MKKNIFAILGALFFIASVVVGYFCDFAAADILGVTLAAFALASVTIAAIEKQKEKNKFSWLTILIIVLAILGAVLVCIGGASSNIFETISGLVIALLTIVIGLIKANKKE